jgi:hypothetical protein
LWLLRPAHRTLQKQRLVERGALALPKFLATSFDTPLQKKKKKGSSTTKKAIKTSGSESELSEGAESSKIGFSSYTKIMLD